MRGRDTKEFTDTNGSAKNRREGAEHLLESHTCATGAKAAAWAAMGMGDRMKDEVSRLAGADRKRGKCC